MVSQSSLVSTLTQLPGFDPQRVPVLAVDDHLPAAPVQAQQPEYLRRRFLHPPDWSPELRAEPRFSDRKIAHASVLIALVQRERLTVLLTERTAHLSTHSGQIAFPGGKADATDAHAADTALREAQEEVGLERHFVQVLGELPTYLTGSAFIVTPVVALVDPDFSLKLNHAEVADVFEVPLDFLMNPAHHRRHSVQWQGMQREWLSMPYMDQGRERFIWGATAGILRNFYRFLAA